MACCNAWFEYIKDCTYFEVPKNKQLDLLHFKMRVVDSLLYFERTHKKKSRGWPTNLPTPPRKKLNKMSAET